MIPLTKVTAPDRYIVQICSTGVNETGRTQCDHMVTALCNDGTVWQYHDNESPKPWHQLPPIPQPTNTPTKGRQ